MTADTKTLALIGCGFFARNQMHAWAEIAGIEVVAVCDLDRPRAETFARDFGVPHVFDDAARMLDMIAIDAVDIATTVASHRYLVELAAAKGLAIICQKPLAETMVAGRAMVTACRDADVAFVIHENFRWQRPFLIMREIIKSGRIGAPHFARLSFRHGYDNYRNQPYLAQIERFTIMDLGLHLFDLARLFMGEVTTLACTAQHLNRAVRGEDAFTALLLHDSGASTICDCSFQSVRRPEPFPETYVEIEGSKGTLLLGPDYHLVLQDAAGTYPIDCEPQVPAWGERPWHCVQDSVIRFQTHFVEVLNGQAEPQPSGADNLKTLALCLAAYASVAERQTIDMATWDGVTS